ncbi:hypothetical protein HaLaN_07141, partial [Haematococcus lacustris]
MSQLAVDLVHTRLSGGSAPHSSTGPTQSAPRPDPRAAQAPTPGAAGPGRQGHKHAGGLATEPLPGQQLAETAKVCTARRPAAVRAGCQAMGKGWRQGARQRPAFRLCGPG